jgi:SAM-dependent methyltransferase
MTGRSVCQLCGKGKQDNAAAVAKVSSNVRRWREHESTVWQCSSCGCLHSLEVVDLGPFYESYPYDRRRLDDFTRRVLSRYVRRLRHHGLSAASSVLDYGCGPGLLLQFLRERGFRECEGYDAYARGFADPAVLSREYDAVVCQDVIEHVEDPQHLLKTLARCVRPGGMLCLGTPCADGIDLRYSNRFIHHLHQPYHLHILSVKALQGISADAGLNLEALYRRHSCDTPLPFVNWRFLHAYLQAQDDTLDAGFDPPRVGLVLKSPRLLILGLFGCLLPSRSDMIAILRKPH